MILTSGTASAGETGTRATGRRVDAGRIRQGDFSTETPYLWWRLDGASGNAINSGSASSADLAADGSIAARATALRTPASACAARCSTTPHDSSGPQARPRCPRRGPWRRGFRNRASIGHRTVVGLGPRLPGHFAAVRERGARARQRGGARVDHDDSAAVNGAGDRDRDAAVAAGSAPAPPCRAIHRHGVAGRHRRRAARQPSRRRAGRCRSDRRPSGASARTTATNAGSVSSRRARLRRVEERLVVPGDVAARCRCVHGAAVTAAALWLRACARARHARSPSCPAAPRARRGLPALARGAVVIALPTWVAVVGPLIAVASVLRASGACCSASTPSPRSTPRRAPRARPSTKRRGARSPSRCARTACAQRPPRSTCAPMWRRSRPPVAEIRADALQQTKARHDLRDGVQVIRAAVDVLREDRPMLHALAVEDDDRPPTTSRRLRAGAGPARRVGRRGPSRCSRVVPDVALLDLCGTSSEALPRRCPVRMALDRAGEPRADARAPRAHQRLDPHVLRGIAGSPRPHARAPLALPPALTCAPSWRASLV